MCLLQGPPFGFAVELVVGFRSLDPIGSGWLRVPITGLGLKVDALQRSRDWGLVGRVWEPYKDDVSENNKLQ